MVIEYIAVGTMVGLLVALCITAAMILAGLADGR